MTPTTCGSLRSSASVASTAWCSAASVSDFGAGTEKTTCAWAPPVPGNFWSRRLSACWDSVPGMETELLVGCLTLTATTAITAITSTHPATTYRRRRKHH